MHVTIPFIDLETQLEKVRSQVDAAIKRVLDHGQFIMGPEVADFEKDLQCFSETKHVISCSNGTDALSIALMALGVGKGDAIFVPSFTFISTAEVVALRLATPVFVDINPRTYTMCPHSLARSIEHAKKLGLKAKGIISVDLFGQPADHDALRKVTEAYALWNIVDAAQSFGALYKGSSTLSCGLISTTSFFPAKPLGCYGDGGAIFTDNEDLASLMRSIRVHGQGKVRYETSRLGITGRLDTLQAAILIEKLKIFPKEVKMRNRVASYYSEGLEGVVETPFVAEGSGSVWAQYTIKTKHRDRMQEGMKAKGVPTVVYYPNPLHTQTPYADFPKDPRGLVETEAVAREVLSLPMHPYLTEDVQDYIIRNLKLYAACSL